MTRRPSYFITGLLNILYLLGAATASILALLRGRKARAGLLDHYRRRAQEAPPCRTSGGRAIWIHGVSVGEILAARQLVQMIKSRFPGWDVVISSTTRLGVEAAAQHYPRHLVLSCPLDFSWLVRRAIRRLRPDILVVIEHDIWPNLLRFARAEGAAVAIINARLSPRSLRGYRRLSRLYPWPPRYLAAICVQDEASAANFLELGFPPQRVHVCGNLKFDNPPPPGAEGVREELGYSSADWILVAGSTHEGEEEAALEALRAVREVASDSFLILVPRRIERVREIEPVIERTGFRFRLRSQGASMPHRRPDVLLVDTMGELARITGAADLVFVGGTLVPLGGHNVIEPASLGRAVIIGPWFQNSRSIVRSFLARNAILVVKSAGEFVAAVVDLRGNRARTRELGRRARLAVEENLGAAQRVLERLEPLFAAGERKGNSGDLPEAPEDPMLDRAEDPAKRREPPGGEEER